MVALVSVLKRRGIRVDPVSDVVDFERAYILEHGGYAGLDAIFLSCDYGSGKSSPHFFTPVLCEMGVDADEVFFVDDQDYCIRAARASGITYCLYADRRQMPSAEALASEIMYLFS